MFQLALEIFQSDSMTVHFIFSAIINLGNCALHSSAATRRRGWPQCGGCGRSARHRWSARRRAPWSHALRRGSCPMPRFKATRPTSSPRCSLRAIDREAARWAGAVQRMDDEHRRRLLGDARAGCALDAGSTSVSAGSTPSSAATTARARRRSALLVAGLAGLGRIDARTAARLDSRYDLGIDRPSRWTRMIDAAAQARPGRRRSAVLAATGMQASDFGDVPRIAPVPCRRGPAADRAGVHGADDRRRGARPDVTEDDRALVDRFLDMMAAEAGASRNTLAAYRSDLERRGGRSGRGARRGDQRSARRPGRELVGLFVGRRWRGGRRRCGASTAS